jgi:hypothetical protein
MDGDGEPEIGVHHRSIRMTNPPGHLAAVSGSGVR